MSINTFVIVALAICSIIIRLRLLFRLLLLVLAPSQVQLVPTNHLPLSLPEQCLITFEFLALHSQQNLLEKRIRSFVLLRKPCGYPIIQNSVCQHLHECKSPTYIFTFAITFRSFELHEQIVNAEKSRCWLHKFRTS